MKRKDTGSFVPTPAAYQGRVYVVSDRGDIDCIDAAKGTILWHDAFPRGRGSFYASPLIAGGHVYAAREGGVIYVAQIQEKFALVAEIDMGDRMIGSPIAVAGRLLIRGERNLYCVSL